MTWRCTHIDAQGRRHRLVVRSHSNRAAAAWMEQIYGEPAALLLINITGGTDE